MRRARQTLGRVKLTRKEARRYAESHSCLASDSVCAVPGRWRVLARNMQFG